MDWDAFMRGRLQRRKTKVNSSFWLVPSQLVALTTAHQSSHCDTESVSFLSSSQRRWWLERVHNFTWWLMDSHLQEAEKKIHSWPRDKSWQCAPFFNNHLRLRCENHWRKHFWKASDDAWCNKRNDATSLLSGDCLMSLSFVYERDENCFMALLDPFFSLHQTQSLCVFWAFSSLHRRVPSSCAETINGNLLRKHSRTMTREHRWCIICLLNHGTRRGRDTNTHGEGSVFTFETRMTHECQWVVFGEA